MAVTTIFFLTHFILNFKLADCIAFVGRLQLLLIKFYFSRIINATDDGWLHLSCLLESVIYDMQLTPLKICER